MTAVRIATPTVVAVGLTEADALNAARLHTRWDASEADTEKVELGPDPLATLLRWWPTALLGARLYCLVYPREAA